MSWGSEITTNILDIVLTTFALLFAGGVLGLYELYKTLRARATEDHRCLISEHKEYLVKRRHETSYSLAGTIYLQLSAVFYSYYRLFLDHPDGIEYQNTVKMAVDFTEYALANYKLLPDDAPQKDILLKKAEHAVFYHKASLRDASQARTALDFALKKLPEIIETFYHQITVAREGSVEVYCKGDPMLL